MNIYINPRPFKSKLFQVQFSQFCKYFDTSGLFLCYCNIAVLPKKSSQSLSLIILSQLVKAWKKYVTRYEIEDLKIVFTLKFKIRV